MKMADRKVKSIEKELQIIDRHLRTITGIKSRQKLLKRKLELKDELKRIKKKKG